MILTISDVYQHHLINTAIVNQVVDKEANREYPLDRINDMRSLINYAPFLCHYCTNESEGLAKILCKPTVMSTSRLFRLHAAMLLALGVIGRLNLEEPVGARQLTAKLGNELVSRVKVFPKLDDMSRHSPYEPIAIDDPASTIEALKIAWKAGELSDRLGMGEQNLYSHPPVACDGERRVIRRGFFFSRVSPLFSHRLIVGICLKPSSQYMPDVPLFRGKALNPIMPEEREAVEICLDGEAISARSDLQRIDRAIGGALAKVIQREEVVGLRTDLNVRKMLIYSAEVREIARSNGHFWRLGNAACEAVVNETYTKALGLDVDSGYALPMFDLIAAGLRSVGGDSQQWTSSSRPDVD